MTSEGWVVVGVTRLECVEREGGRVLFVEHESYLLINTSNTFSAMTYGMHSYNHVRAAV